MAYNKTNWVDGVTPLSAGNMNKIEGQLESLENNKVDKVAGKGLSTNDYTTTEKNKLAGIQAGAEVNKVTSVAGKTGAVTVTKGDVGLGSVLNYGIATKAEAEAGTSNSKYMTPLRVKEAIEKKVSEYKVITLTNSGTFTVPDGVYVLDVFLISAGNGGDSGYFSSSNIPYSGSGGNSGDIVFITLPVSPGLQIPYVIGAGGRGGTYAGGYASRSSGGTGGDTIFNKTICKGGGGERGGRYDGGASVKLDPPVALPLLPLVYSGQGGSSVDGKGGNSTTKNGAIGCGGGGGKNATNGSGSSVGGNGGNGIMFIGYRQFL